VRESALRPVSASRSPGATVPGRQRGWPGRGAAGFADWVKGLRQRHARGSAGGSCLAPGCGPAFGARPGVPAIPPDVAAGTAAIGHHLVVLQAGPAQPARDDGGPPRGETFRGRRAYLVGHDCPSPPGRAPAIPDHGPKMSSSSPVSQLARRPLAEMLAHDDVGVPMIRYGQTARVPGDPRRVRELGEPAWTVDLARR
jgi:hypothetical protein